MITIESYCKRNLILSVLKFILLPFSFIYLLGFYLKKLITKKYHLKNAVVIGNITMGGTGKTPITIMLANYFKNSVIVTRGYSGNFEGIITDKKISDGYSDETLLYIDKTEKIPIVVGKNRIKLLKEKKIYKDNILIFDDAMQYFPLVPGITICLIDGNCPFGNNFVIPSGILREPISRLKKCDIVLIKDIKGLKNNALKRIKKYKKPIFGFKYKNIGIFNLKTDKKIEPPEKVIAFCSIGNPNSFKESLLKEGIDIKKFYRFSDHYKYKERDIKKIKEANLPLLTTEKDGVKLKKLDLNDIYFLKIEPMIDNEKDFLNTIGELFENNNN